MQKIMQSTLPSGSRSHSAKLHQLYALGDRNYLDSIDHNNHGNNNTDNNGNGFINEGGGQRNQGGSLGGAGIGGGRGGGARTVIRSATNTVTYNAPNYGRGGGRPKAWGPQSQLNNEVRNKVVAIRQPQELLDFVIQDERLSVSESCF